MTAIEPQVSYVISVVFPKATSRQQDQGLVAGSIKFLLFPLLTFEKTCFSIKHNLHDVMKRRAVELV